MRMAQSYVRQAHHVQQFLHPLPALTRPSQAEQREWTLYGLGDREPRVQRRSDILEHDLCLLAERAEVGAREFADIGTVKFDTATVLVQQPQSKETERRLATAAFADETQHLAWRDRQTRCPPLLCTG
jgi:hypothetical protein